MSPVTLHSEAAMSAVTAELVRVLDGVCAGRDRAQVMALALGVAAGQLAQSGGVPRTEQALVNLLRAVSGGGRA